MNINTTGLAKRLPWLAAIVLTGIAPFLAAGEASPAVYQGLKTNQFMLEEKLVLAAGRGDMDEARSLLERGVSVNGKDKRGLTPLPAACSRNSPASQSWKSFRSRRQNFIGRWSMPKLPS